MKVTFFVTDLRHRLIKKTVDIEDQIYRDKNNVIFWLAEGKIPKFGIEYCVIDLRPFTINVDVDDIITSFVKDRLVPPKMKDKFFDDLRKGEIPDIRTHAQKIALTLFFYYGEKFFIYNGKCSHIVKVHDEYQIINGSFITEALSYFYNIKSDNFGIYAVIPAVIPKTITPFYIKSVEFFNTYVPLDKLTIVNLMKRLHKMNPNKYIKLVGEKAEGARSFSITHLSTDALLSRVKQPDFVKNIFDKNSKPIFEDIFEDKEPEYYKQVRNRLYLIIKEQLKIKQKDEFTQDNMLKYLSVFHQLPPFITIKFKNLSPLILYLFSFLVKLINNQIGGQFIYESNVNQLSSFNVAKQQMEIIPEEEEIISTIIIGEERFTRIMNDSLIGLFGPGIILLLMDRVPSIIYIARESSNRIRFTIYGQQSLTTAEQMVATTISNRVFGSLESVNQLFRNVGTSSVPARFMLNHAQIFMMSNMNELINAVGYVNRSLSARPNVSGNISTRQLNNGTVLTIYRNITTDPILRDSNLVLLTTSPESIGVALARENTGQYSVRFRVYGKYQGRVFRNQIQNISIEFNNISDNFTSYNRNRDVLEFNIFDDNQLMFSVSDIPTAMLDIGRRSTANIQQPRTPLLSQQQRQEESESESEGESESEEEESESVENNWVPYVPEIRRRQERERERQERERRTEEEEEEEESEEEEEEEEEE